MSMIFPQMIFHAFLIQKPSSDDLVKLIPEPLSLDDEEYKNIDFRT